MSSPSNKRPGEGGISPPPSKRPIKQLSTTTKSAVANFFTPVSKKPPEKLSWRIVNSTLIAGRYVASDKTESEKRPTNNEGSKFLVAAFDFDSTIIKTISKARFSRDANDWCWWHGSVPGKLKELHAKGYSLVIMSNQSGISLRLPANAPKVIKGDRLTQFKQKAAAVFNNLNLPIRIYAATEKDQFRKPASGMWEEFLKDHSLVATDIDLKNSIFVGDAGGRKGDFACSDRNFSTNIGIEYKTPEEFFLDQLPQPYSRSFEPLDYLVDRTAEADNPVFKVSKSKEIALFVGTPGAGKSTFFHNYLQPLAYVRINQDILKTREKCLAVAADSLKENKSIAIDNTNPDREVRKSWISLASKHGVPIRCFLFTASQELGRHNDGVRAISGRPEMNPESRQILPQLAFNSFASRYQEPKEDEGFSEIVPIDFRFNGTEEDKKVWRQYWN